MIPSPKLIAGGVAIAMIVGAFFYGVSVGKDREEAKWLAAELERSQALQEAFDAAIDINAKREAENAILQIQVEKEKQQSRRLANEIESLNARTPAVQIRRIEVPGECPAVACPVPDIRLDVRLHNCAIDPASCDVPDSDSPDIVDGSVPITDAAPEFR